MTLQVAVLGATGRWGANILKTVATLEGVKVTVATGRDWSSALDAPGLDAAIIASPPSAHTAQALYALGRGLPLFIEKPLALSEADALAIADAAGNTPVLVDHTQLFHPAYTALKERLGGREITKIVSIGGGPGPVRDDCDGLWDYGAHDAAFAVDLLGCADVRCERVTQDPAAPDHTANYFLNFGTTPPYRAYVGNGMAIKTRQLQIHTTSGLFFLDDRDPASKLYLNWEPLSYPDQRPPLTVALDVFFKLVRGTQDPRAGLALSIEVVRLLEKAHTYI